MIIKPLTLSYLTLVGVISGGSAIGADGTGLQLSRRAVTEAIDGIAEQGQGLLRWSNGGFLYTSPGGGIAPSFFTLGRDGKLLSSTKLTIPGASRVICHAADRAGDNSIVFAGLAWSSEGQRTPFLAWLSPEGRTETVISTEPYIPFALSVAPDGTAWTLGYETLNHDALDPGINPNAKILRHFDRSGKLIGSAWPQSGFETGAGLYSISKGYLFVTKDRIGWYSFSTHGEGRYVEADTRNMNQDVFPGLPRSPSNRMVDAFALTEAGDVLLSMEDRTPAGITTYFLDRATSKWRPLPTPSLGSYGPILLGTDQADVVLQYERSAAFYSLTR